MVEYLHYGFDEYCWGCEKPRDIKPIYELYCLLVGKGKIMPHNEWVCMCMCVYVKWVMMAVYVINIMIIVMIIYIIITQGKDKEWKYWLILYLMHFKNVSSSAGWVGPHCWTAIYISYLLPDLAAQEPQDCMIPMFRMCSQSSLHACFPNRALSRGIHRVLGECIFNKAKLWWGVRIVAGSG